MKRIRKQKQKWIALACALALAVSLAGCGASGNSSAAYDTAAGSYVPSAEPSAPQDAAEWEEAGYSTNEAHGTDGASLPTDGRKIILNASLTIEALDFDATCAALMQSLRDAGGYVASADQHMPSYEGARRSAVYELRVPAAQYDAFLQGAGDAGNLVYRQESSEDVTRAYVDVEARLKSLRLQEDRLYAMMEQAGELETLLAIQNQLTEVQYQIESFTAQQRAYDDLISYSTVTVSVEEVRVFTETPVTFGDRVSEAFRSSWRSFGVGLQDFAILLIGLIPTLLVLAVLALIFIPVIRAASRRSREKAAARRPADYSAGYAKPEADAGQQEANGANTPKYS